VAKELRTHDTAKKPGHGPNGHHDDKCCEKILAKLDEIIRILHELVVPIPTGFAPITQIPNGVNMTGNQIVAGTRGIFNTTYVPAGAVPPAGSPGVIWAASDASVVASNDPSDPSGLTADVDVPATFPPNTTFQLGVSQALSTPITGGPITITVLPAVGPAPTGFGPINQVS
jgi:hypothetical protein